MYIATYENNIDIAYPDFHQQHGLIFTRPYYKYKYNSPYSEYKL